MNFQAFYQLSNLDHHAISFDKISEPNFIKALEEAISLAKIKLNKWKENQLMTFESVVADYEAITEEVGMVSNIFFNLYAAHSTKELQQMSETFSDLSTRFQLSMTLDSEVFAKVKKFYDLKSELKLSKEQDKILEKIYTDFTRNGALLSAEDKKKLELIDEELAKVQLRFSENVLKATKSYELHMTDKTQLQGIPALALASAAEEAKKRNKSGWVFTLDHGSYLAVMKYANNSSLREKIYRAYTSRATTGESNNYPLIEQILNLRLDRAKLLGFDNFAQYTLAQRMAKDVSIVEDFIASLYKRAYPKGKEEFEALAVYAKAHGASNLQKWDIAYYSERLKEEKFSFNEEEIRPYFPLTQVTQGVFSLTKTLYGLTYKKVKHLPTYAEQIDVYEVYDEKGCYLSLLYMDLFPRETKKQGAWMTSFIEQGSQFGKNLRPHVAVVCNFAPGVGQEPALLSWQDVLTLFHEFGHALHGMLSRCHYRYLSGTNVFWDFVELPSQIMENWAKSKECLLTFAKHFKTQEPLPSALLDKILAADTFQSGLFTLRQLSFATLDLIYHSLESSEQFSQSNVLEKKVLSDYSFLAPLPGESMSCGFSHIFAGGYAAGYYSYKWAEVLDADAFAMFKEQGVLNPAPAKKFRENILERGGTEDPMELYIKFRGRAPSVDPLIERLGL